MAGAHIHAHHVRAGDDRRALSIALALILGFMLAEVVVGVLAGSLALLSDAGHMLTDAAAIGLSLVAARLAARPAEGAMTYGLGRAEILSAQVNGITLQSSVLDYPANFSNAAGLMPTFAADGWFHKKTGIEPPPADLASFMETVTQFAQGPYARALKAFPKADPATVETLSRYLGLPASELEAWRLNVEAADRLGHSAFLVELLRDRGLALGAYDGRVTGIDTGISAIVSPDGGMNDPTMAAVGGVYTTMWNSYLNNDLYLLWSTDGGLTATPIRQARYRSRTAKAIRRSTPPAISPPPWPPIPTCWCSQPTATTIR